MSAPIRRLKMAAGKVGGEPRNTTNKQGGGGNSVAPIKNAVGMCNVGGSGYSKIKGTVSG